jgi:cytochrome d ubiquinol oxidase subunit I
VVRGLAEVPRADRPPVAIVHVAFQIMVGCGLALLVTGLLGAVLAWRRRRLPDARWFLRLVMLCGPLGFIAIEAGWVVTEVGRQPWIIHGILRTRDAVTPMPGIVVPFVTFTLLYVLLAAIVIVLLKRQVFASPRILVPGGAALGRPGGRRSPRGAGPERDASA